MLVLPRRVPVICGCEFDALQSCDWFRQWLRAGVVWLRMLAVAVSAQTAALCVSESRNVTGAASSPLLSGSLQHTAASRKTGCTGTNQLVDTTAHTCACISSAVLLATCTAVCEGLLNEVSMHRTPARSHVQVYRTCGAALAFLRSSISSHAVPHLLCIYPASAGGGSAGCQPLHGLPCLSA